MKYFLGIDVGSSKTHALIADEEACVLALDKRVAAIIKVSVMKG